MPFLLLLNSETNSMHSVDTRVVTLSLAVSLLL